VQGISNGTGISVVSKSTLINCSVSAVNGGPGISAGSTSSLTNCTVVGSNNGAQYGISTGAGCSLANCVADSNTLTGSSSAGISVGAGSTLTNCLARNNTAVYGIYCGNGSCSLSNCVAASNTSSASNSFGILAYDGSTIVGCSARLNTNTGAASNFTGVGIATGYGCTIKDCAVKENKGDGIYVPSECFVFNNTSTENCSGAVSGSGGIHAGGNKNRIDSNHVAVNFYDGILVDSSGRDNVVVRNVSDHNAQFQFRIPGINSTDQCCLGDNRIGAIVSDPSASNANTWSNLSP